MRGPILVKHNTLFVRVTKGKQLVAVVNKKQKDPSEWLQLVTFQIVDKTCKLPIISPHHSDSPPMIFARLARRGEIDCVLWIVEHQSRRNLKAAYVYGVN